jgi:RNA recognition motif-containing protein
VTVLPASLVVARFQNRKPAAPLQALFTPFGQVDSVRLVRDHATRQSQGFGFVEMADANQGRAGCTGLDQQEFEGRRLTVNEARPPEPRSGVYSQGIPFLLS